MSVKDNFTQEEWKSLMKAPMLVSYAVAGAAPSGEDGFIQEMAAVADAIIEGGERVSKDSLTGMVVADIVANAEDEKRGQTESISVKQIKDRALDCCRMVAGLLQTKANPEESYQYKQWVLTVAHHVAAAAKEGGIFGIGATQISGTEVATINEIGEALDI